MIHNTTILVKKSNDSWEFDELYDKSSSPKFNKNKFCLFRMKNRFLKFIYRQAKYTIIQRNYCGITSSLRKLPDFLVIGGKRCGTTSLFQFLQQHPMINLPPFDHMGFFDDNFHLGIRYYKSFYPLKTKHNNLKLDYDVTTSYLTSPYVPERIHQYLPNVKMIVLLRNPVNRALSEYHSNLRSDPTYGKFESYIDNELKELATYDFSDKVFNNNYNLKNPKTSYLKKGLYVDFLRKWFNLFPKKNFLIMPTELFAKDEKLIYEKIFGFLGLPDFEIKNTRYMEKGHYSPMDNHLQMKLDAFFKQKNLELFQLIGQKFDW